MLSTVYDKKVSTGLTALDIVRCREAAGLVSTIANRGEIIIFSKSGLWSKLELLVLVKVLNGPEEVYVTVDHGQLHPLYIAPIVTALATCHEQLRDILSSSVGRLVEKVDMDDIVLFCSASKLNVSTFTIVNELGGNRPPSSYLN